MATTFHVDIVSAEREIWSGTATGVYANAEMGDIGILPNHTPLLTRLDAGEVRVTLDKDKEIDFYVSGGVLEVQAHKVTVLSDTVIRAEDLDEAKALEAMKHAEHVLQNQDTKINFSRARAELLEAAAQLKTIQNLRKRK